ncbi:SgcJ/EcaC family oxidoreductase [Kribbella sp. ALI-6-A]|uniref:SgcJ/EcaC family oxidoreductase n=1 Tax=Kribbella sp. ALI-6-A TaxID=1933817 RepID=UPI00143DACDA|nr:SgcJ/EcaC family oxidoreductase [Kribbella sp. ALI-6-A]
MRTTLRRIVVAGVVALGVGTTLTAGAAADQQAGRVPDKVVFDRLLQQQADAWTHESGAEFAATFHPDADVVTFNGDHLRGRAEIAREMQRYFDTYIEDTTFRTLSEQIRYLERDVAAIVRTSCLITAPATTCRPDSLSINTNVMHKVHGRWLQASFQNTRVEPLP